MSGAGSGAQRANLTDPEVLECPFGYYAERHADPQGAKFEEGVGWVVTGVENLGTLSRDPALSSESQGPDGMKLMGISPEPYSPEVEELVESMHPMANVVLFADPPTHTRTRKLATQALNAAKVRALEPMLLAKAEALLDTFQDAEQCDLVAQFAEPMPAHVMGNMLGIDSADMEDFTRWCAHTASGVGDALNNEQRLVVGRSVKEFQEYILERVKLRRIQRSDDLLDAIVHAELTNEDLAEDGGELTGPRSLDDSEIIAVVIQLLAGGNHTTTGLIGTAISRLLLHPEVMAEVRADHDLIQNLLDETLRIDAPVQFGFRAVTAPVQVNDTAIDPGSMVLMGWGASGHDPEVFPEPERFDIHRENGRRHMSFGYGRHFCVGSHLARAEASIAISALLRRFDDIQLVEGTELTHHPVFTFSSLNALPVRLVRSKGTTAASVASTAGAPS